MRIGKRIVAYGREFLSFRWVRDTWMYLVRIVERMQDNHIFLSAAGIAFNTLLCFIPLLLIVFYIMGFYLSSDSALRTVDSYLNSLDLFPYQREQLRTLLVNVISEFVRGSHIAGVVGGIGLIWTASTLFAAFRTALDKIYGVKDTMNILVSTLKDFAMLSIVGIALLLVHVSFYSLTIVRGIGKDVFGLEWNHWLFSTVISQITPLAVTFLLFCVIFFLVPDVRLPYKAIVLSSAIAALLWGLAKAVMAYYLAHLWSLGKIYGPYAILVATALWIYYSNITLLFAAEIGEMYLERKRLKDIFSHKRLEETMGSITIEK
jgi:membrane protein